MDKALKVFAVLDVSSQVRRILLSFHPIVGYGPKLLNIYGDTAS
jgi:hypothetical protein